MEKASPQVEMLQSSNNPQIVLASDENAMIKRIQATHGPENHDIPMEPLLDTIQFIVELCDSVSGEYPPKRQLEPLSDENLGNMCEHLAYKINSISCEILINCSGGQDAQDTILAIFSSLSPFKWDAKGVIALAAFAVNYGEVCLISQIHNTNPIAKSLALLEQLPEVLNSFESSMTKRNMAELTMEMLDLNKCICEFKNLPKNYIKPDTPELATAEAQFPTAIYWTIRSIVICQAQILNLTSIGYEYIVSATEAWELSSLVKKVKELRGHLNKQLDLCKQHVEDNRVNELYQKTINLFEITHEDNTHILKILVGSQEDALFNGNTRRLADVEILKKNTVLLYISGLELSQPELAHFTRIHITRQDKSEFDGEYDVVWIPVVDNPWHEANQRLFKARQDEMPWFSPKQLPSIDPAVIKYIKNAWHFEKTSMMIPLIPNEKVLNSNAMHMMFIWENQAYPFTGTREEQLWAAETWRLEFLVDSIESSITGWINEGKHICLYGGEDMEWIRKFTTTLASVAKSAEVSLEMIYMGTSNPKENVESNIDKIESENLSHVLKDLDQIWLFWFRLESMWHSRVQRGMSPETDRIIQEIFVMHSFDCSGRGWALISIGSKSNEIAKAMGDTMLNCLAQFDQWKSQVAEKGGFLTALKDHILQTSKLEGCCNKLSWKTSSGIPAKMVCFECGRSMMKTITFSCGRH